MNSMLTLKPVYQDAPQNLPDQIFPGLAIQLQFKANPTGYIPPILHFCANLSGSQPREHLYSLTKGAQSADPNIRPTAREIGEHLEHILEASRSGVCEVSAYLMIFFFKCASGGFCFEVPMPG